MAKLIPVVALSALKNKQPVRAEHRGVPYCIIKMGEEVNAFVTICTHKDLAMFPPLVKKEYLVCPHHGVAFDCLTGKIAKAHGKDADPLPKVAIELIDGIVYLKTRKRHRKLVPKAERKWVAKQAKKLAKKRRKTEHGEIINAARRFATPAAI